MIKGIILVIVNADLHPAGRYKGIAVIAGLFVLKEAFLPFHPQGVVLVQANPVLHNAGRIGIINRNDVSIIVIHNLGLAPFCLRLIINVSVRLIVYGGRAVPLGHHGINHLDTGFILILLQCIIFFHGEIFVHHTVHMIGVQAEMVFTVLRQCVLLIFHGVMACFLAHGIIVGKGFQVRLQLLAAVPERGILKQAAFRLCIREIGIKIRNLILGKKGHENCKQNHNENHNRSNDGAFVFGEAA